MHILILEAHLSGHHPIYLERIAGQLSSVGHQVTIALAATEMSHPAIQRLKTDWPTLQIHPILSSELDSAAKSPFGIAGREIGMRKVFANVYRQVMRKQHIDRVLLPYADYCLHAMALLGSPFGETPWSGICMRPSFHMAAAGVLAPKPSFAWAKERLFFRLLKQPSLTRLFTIDEFLHEHAASRLGKNAIVPIAYLPDPAELRGGHTKLSARELFGIPGGKFVVLAYGSLDERKGLRPLLAALASPEMERDVFLLLVGRQSPAIKSLLQSEPLMNLSRQRRLLSIDRFVGEEEEQAAFAAADIVWLGYVGHYAMSGVLVLAAQAGKPVISTRDGLIGRYVQEYGLGLTVTVEPEAISKAISELRRVGRPLPVEAHKFQAHTWNGFLSKLLEALG